MVGPGRGQLHRDRPVGRRAAVGAPATIGTSALVPNVDGTTAGPRCFTVAQADAAAGGTPTGPVSDPVCTAGATPEQMQPG